MASKVGKVFSLIASDGLGAVCRRAVGRLVMKLTSGRAFAGLPLQSDKVLFTTFTNRYECNPKYITEELLRQKTPYDIVWVVRDSKLTDREAFPSQVRVVGRESLAHFRELATARVWVDNGINCLKVPIEKKPGQVMIETWHGSMGLKRIDSHSTADAAWLAAVRRTGSASDYCVSNSQFETEVFRASYWPDTEICEFGHARNDALCAGGADAREAVRQRLSGRYKLSPACKWVLYAPTFRDAHSSEYEAIDLDRVADALGRRFSGEWVVLTRLHFHDRGKAAGLWAGSRHVDVSDYADMQELLLAVDAGITDYSSWCCDFVLTGRPCFLFVPDYSSFSDDRGFYYPLSETPFPIAEDNDALEDAIVSFDEARYGHDRERFLAARGCKEDGNAARRVAELIADTLNQPLS